MNRFFRAIAAAAVGAGLYSVGQGLKDKVPGMGGDTLAYTLAAVGTAAALQIDPKGQAKEKETTPPK